MVSVPDASVHQDGESVTGEPRGLEESNAATEVHCRDGDARSYRSQGIVWRNVILMGLLHIAAVYSLVVIPRAQHLTWIWCKSAGDKELALCNYSVLV